jgi:hypothetical protein
MQWVASHPRLDPEYGLANSGLEYKHVTQFSQNGKSKICKTSYVCSISPDCSKLGIKYI